MKKFGKRKLALAVSMGVLMTGQLQAQGSLVLEEITVTAQKTTEMLQDVPVSVSAVTGAVFEQNAAFELQELNKFVPGLYMNGNKSQPNITMRGVNTTSGGATTPRTNIFYDGSYVPNQQVAFFSQFDIQRFEVLKGPQGTLYGKASPTASIVIHTENPDLTQTEGYIKQSVGQNDLFNTQFGVSIPLIENELGLRIAGMYDENNSADRRYVNVDQDQLSRSKGGRMTLLWQPRGIFSGRLSHTHVEYDTNQSRWIGAVAPGSTAEGLPSGGSHYSDRRDYSDQPTHLQFRIDQTILEMNADLDWATLTSQTYYARSTNDEIIDQDGTAAAQKIQETNINLSKLFNQELRLSSTDNDFWNWIVGAYYSNTSARTTVVNDALQVNGAIIQPPPGNYPARVSTRANVRLDSASEDWGVFTHNTFYLTDDWTLTVGARWNREVRKALNTINTDIWTEMDYGGGYNLANYQQRPGASFNSDKWIAWTGTVKLAYQIDVDQMVYFTVDRGGRVGGQQLDLAGTTPGSMVSISPESANSFELGYKSELLDRRLRLNAAMYYQTYRDFQFPFEGQPLDTNQDGTYDNTFRATPNAKEVIAKGAEVEVTYLFNENLSGMLSVSYNDTKFEDFDNAICSDGIRTLTPDGAAYMRCDFSGQRLGSDSGNWNVMAMTNYSLPLQSFGSEWYFDVLYNFTSERVSPNTRMKSASYGTFDLFTGVRSLDGVWDVKFWVKNAFDKDAVQNRNYFETTYAVPGTAGLSPTGVMPIDLINNPRQFGVTGTWRF